MHSDKSIVMISMAILLGASLSIAALLVFFNEAPRRPLSMDWDFMCYYVSAQLLLEGQSPYNIAAQERRRADYSSSPTTADGKISYLYPPAFLLFIIPLALLPASVASTIWMTLQALNLYCGVGCLLRETRSLNAWLILLSFLLLWLPVFAAFKFGQISIFLLAALLAFGRALKRESNISAGIWLAALCAKPMLLIVPVFSLIYLRRWKALLSCAACVGVLTIISFCMVGAAGIREYLTALDLAVQRNSPGGPYRASTYSWALLTAPLGDSEMVPLIALDLLTILGCFWAIRMHGLQGAFGVIAVASTLVSSQVLIHDVALWIGALPCILRRRFALAFPVLICVFAAAWISPLVFGSPHLTVFAGIGVIVFLVASRQESCPTR